MINICRIFIKEFGLVTEAQLTLGKCLAYVEVSHKKTEAAGFNRHIHNLYDLLIDLHKKLKNEKGKSPQFS